MREILLTVLLGFCILSMQSCTKSPTETVIPGTVDDTTWAAIDTITNVTDSLAKPVVIDSFNCTTSNENANIINIGDSISVNFPVGSCMTSANDASTTIKKSAKIKTEIRVMASKGDLIRFHASTISNANNIRSLLSIGYFINIKLSFKEKEVFWNSFSPPIQVRVKASNINQMMTSFTFLPVSPFSKDSTWLYNGFPVQTIKDSQKHYWYQISTNRTRLFGCAYYVDKNNLLSKTRLNVFLPLRYTNKNTAVFAVFNNYKSVVRLQSNATGKSYSVADIPVNASVTIVSISKINGNYYLGNSSVNVQNSKPFLISPNQIDSPSLNNYLKSL